MESDNGAARFLLGSVNKDLGKTGVQGEQN